MQHLCHMDATRVRCYLRLVPGSLEYAGMLADEETEKTMSNGGGSRTVIREKRDDAMGGNDETPYGIDITRPNVARMYDYYLGGKDNYAADREAARGYSDQRRTCPSRRWKTASSLSVPYCSSRGKRT
jgi:S-adenosyl methyltransferase